LESTINGYDIVNRTNLFTDTTVIDDNGKKADYKNGTDFYSHPNFVRVKSLNGQDLPPRNNMIFIPQHNHDGHRQLLADLTDYVSADSFKSLEVLVQDPISAEFMDEKGAVIYSYNREAKAKFNDGAIKYLGTDKRIYGKVEYLPDTIVVCRDYYSYPAIYFSPPWIYDGRFIKESTSHIKRFKITFDIADTVNVSSGIEDQFIGNHESSNGLTLSQNYPNPATALTSINFFLVQSGPVTLQVMNLVGQEVATLVSGDLSSGEHQINFDTSRLPEGVYIYILRTPNAVSSKKMIVN